MAHSSLQKKETLFSQLKTYGVAYYAGLYGKRELACERNTDFTCVTVTAKGQSGPRAKLITYFYLMPIC
jgi:hypothetical protein